MTASTQLYCARAISVFGDTLRYIVIGLVAVAFASNPSQISLIEAIEYSGMLLGSLALPMFIDRLPYSRTLYLADFASFILSILFLTVVNLNSFVGVAALCLLFFAMSSVHSAALDALVSELNIQEKRSILEGFTNLQLLVLVAGLFAVIFATAVQKFVPLSGLIVIDSATFLVSSVWIRKLHRQTKVELRGASEVSSSGLQFWRELQIGIWAVRQRSALLPLIASQALLGIAHGLFSAASIVHLVKRFELAGPVAVLGINYSYRIGSIFGALVRRFARVSVGAGLIFGFGTVIIAYFGMALSSHIAFFFLFHFVQQLAATVQVISNRTLVQLNAPVEHRGKVTAFRNLSIDIGLVVGTWLSVAILGKYDSTVPFLLSGFIAVVGLVLSYRSRSDPQK